MTFTSWLQQVCNEQVTLGHVCTTIGAFLLGMWMKKG